MAGTAQLQHALPRDFLPLFQNREMKFRPGERFSYSNAGFILLGLIAEQAAGQSFTELITERVLIPAGMIDSGYFPLDSSPRGRRRATSRTATAGGPTSSPAGHRRAGWRAFTTAPDMARFWAALRAHRR